MIGVESPARTPFRADTDSCTRTCVSGANLRLCDDGGVGASRVSDRAGDALSSSAWPGAEWVVEVGADDGCGAQAPGLQDDARGKKSVRESQN